MSTLENSKVIPFGIHIFYEAILLSYMVDGLSYQRLFPWYSASSTRGSYDVAMENLEVVSFGIHLFCKVLMLLYMMDGLPMQRLLP